MRAAAAGAVAKVGGGCPMARLSRLRTSRKPQAEPRPAQGFAVHAAQRIRQPTGHWRGGPCRCRGRATSMRRRAKGLGGRASGVQSLRPLLEIAEATSRVAGSSRASRLMSQRLLGRSLLPCRRRPRKRTCLRAMRIFGVHIDELEAAAVCLYNQHSSKPSANALSASLWRRRSLSPFLAFSRDSRPVEETL